MMCTIRSLCLAAITVISCLGTARGEQGPVRVFILAGQSNMEGNGWIASEPERNGGRGSLEFLVRDPATAGRFFHLIDAAGAWRTRDDVWISYLDRRGPLTVGYGASPKVIGPELGFGWVVGDAFDEPVLLVKCAWGGKSLAIDFRPPSAGKPPYSLGEKGDAEIAADPTILGRYYREIVSLTRTALGRVKELVPGSDGRYVLCGFGWHQGWNDRINDKFNAEYESNMSHFIRDMRKELGEPGLPFVIAETGMNGPDETHPRALSLMKAQAAVAERPEFKGNVAFVGTKAFWRPKEQSPSGQGYHWNSNAETYYLIGHAMGEAMMGLVKAKPPEIRPGEMSGYLLVPNDRVPETYDGGFSMYVAAWPLLAAYPGSRFQSGLFGTWMFAGFDGKAPEKLYSDIEGGLGWWRDTRFATETPKFIMGGVAPNFVEWANGPGAGKGRDWNKPAGKYAVAQLSPWVLWPPDGLNLKQGTCGELFGYGYLPLPLTKAKPTTNGKAVPTGDNSWTLFLNTANFKGPVAFFTPYFWSRVAAEEPRFAGLLLDSRPSNPNRALQMETQYIPAVQATDAQGDTWARVAATRFPAAADGAAPLVHRISSYTRQALWDDVQAWFEGGPPASGLVDPAEEFVHRLPGHGGATWKIFADGTAKDEKRPLAWDACGKPTALDDHTFGYLWNDGTVAKTDVGGKPVVTLPEFFRLSKDGPGGKTRWVPVAADAVPTETGLSQVAFGRPERKAQEAYVTPEEPTSCWKTPGPVAGPFQVTLGDGSVVTYSWYRFADQPALLNADLTPAEREEVQARVERLHRAWTKDRDYLPPPTRGTLAEIDPALLVSPPAGFEAGYVPIVTRQGPAEAP